ncbi:MAG: epimerase, partial [Planctomycetes bacterium RBG_16_64_10]
MAGIENIDALEEQLSRPTDTLVTTLAGVAGDLLILGVGGKMGPSLARMALRASRAAGSDRRVTGVSRFSNPALRQALEDWGIDTIQGDLLDVDFLASLPETANVIYMAGRKFGTSAAEPLTWASNTLLPALVCRRFPSSRIVAFSTGNVYAPVPVAAGRGSVETDPPGPLGEYAMSCLGRERLFEYFSLTAGTRIALIRLNYATELRYGVLVDLASKVFRQQAVALDVGFANVIWQGDASALALCALADVSTPPLVLNVTGPEWMSCRQVCEQFGRLMDRPVRFAGSEGPTALMSDARQAFRRYSMPRVPLDEIVAWTANWVIRGGQTYDKPTHY